MAAVSIRNSALFADANLKALWELENVNDSKASYNLTNVNTVAFNAAKFDNGADFGSSNTNKKLQIASDIGISNGSTAFSIMGWVKMNTEIASGTGALFFLNTGTNIRQNAVYYDYNGGTRRLVYTIYHNNSGEHSYPINYNVTLGTTDWHLVAFVYNGSNQLEAFFDGASVGTSAPNTAVGSADAADFELGAGVGFLSGILDDWALFNDVLTSTEIADHYSGADAISTSITVSKINLMKQAVHRSAFY